jgi:hypothetical protein
MPENKAKNQIKATPVEVKAGSHRAVELKELMNFIDLKALGPRVKKVTPQVCIKQDGRLELYVYRRTWKGEGDKRQANSRLYVLGQHDKRDRGWINTYLLLKGQWTQVYSV